MFIGFIIAVVFLFSLLIYFNVKAEVEFQRQLRKMEEEEKNDHRQSH